MDKLNLNLLKQYWITGSEDPHGDPADLTSHGKIEFYINGMDISGCSDSDTDYGLNQSAIRLLQTVFVDNIPNAEHVNPIFYHGCYLLGTCPNCVIDYRVRHQGELVKLDQFFVSGGSSENDPDGYKNSEIKISNRVYAKQVIIFGKQVLDFLSTTKEVSAGDEWELDIYFQLRTYLNELLDLAQVYLGSKCITDEMVLKAQEVDLTRPFLS